MTTDFIARGLAAQTQSRLADVAPGEGAAIVGFRRDGSHTTPVTLHDKAGQVADLRDWIGGNWSQDNDYSSEFQKACDECDDVGGTINGGTTLRLPEGRIVLAAPVEHKRHAIIGHGPTGTTIWWEGPSDVPVMVQNNNNQKLTGIRFHCANDAAPLTWYQLNGKPGSRVFDFGMWLRDIFFGKATGPALVLPSIVNAYMRDCRWNAARSLIEIRSSGLGSWNRILSLRQCTVDWSAGLAEGGSVEDLIRYSLQPDSAAADVLTVALQDWRIEGDATSLAPDFAILRVADNGYGAFYDDPTKNSVSTRPVMLHLSDIGFDVRKTETAPGSGVFTTAPAGAAIIRQDVGQSNVLCPLLMENVQFNDMPNWYAGTLLGSNYVHVPSGAVTSERIPFCSVAPEAVRTGRKLAFGESALTSATAGFQITHVSGPGIFTGTANPEGSVAATSGSIYLRKASQTGFSFYLKDSGTGTSGWVLMNLKPSGLTVSNPVLIDPDDNEVALLGAINRLNDVVRAMRAVS